jgi:hypothetical protein
VKKPREIRNIVCVSDTHVGCKLALMHPDGATVDEGNVVHPSPIQRKLWAVWEQFWGEWVPAVTHGEPFAVVHNGDAVDGVHHNSTTQWSHNLADQRAHAEKILRPVVDACEGRYYHVRGTEAHVGKSGTEEEQLAKALGAVASADGHHARWELWKRIGDRLAHFSHHIGTTSSAAHETSAVNAELASCFNEAGRWGHEPPAIIVRSHRHRCSEIRLPSQWGYATAFVTGAWQLKTPYVFRIPGGRNSTPQIGASLIRHGGEELHTRHFVRDLGRPTPE